MNIKKYIKVTPKGSEESFVVTAVNEDFYKGQEAKIEEPTEEEVLANFPEERPTKTVEVPTVQETEEYLALATELEVTKTELETTKVELEATKAELLKLKK